MSEWSRRNLIRASGAAAVAVPMSALISTTAEASAKTPDVSQADLDAFASESVMFVVRDAARGEISILHGEQEVVVRDRDLVARVAGAAARGSKVG
jgi:hypothetical protein